MTLSLFPRSLGSLETSPNPFERAIARCLLDRFERRADAEKWWREEVLIEANDPDNEGFTWRRPEKAAMEELRVECGIVRELQTRGWQSQADGTTIPAIPDTPEVRKPNQEAN